MAVSNLTFLRMLILLAQLNPKCIGAFLRLQCQMSVNFSVVIENAALTGAVVQSSELAEMGECQLACLMNEQCQSINYQNIGDHKCEINKDKVYGHATKDVPTYFPLVPRYGWTYMSSDTQASVGDACQMLDPCEEHETCRSTCECPGYICDRDSGKHFEAWRDCDHIRRAGYVESGRYWIKGRSFPENKLPVYCDMDTDENGWMVIQRRVDNGTDFDRVWTEYQFGFGDLDGNYWIGLENLSNLAGPSLRAMLRIDLNFSNAPTERRFVTYNSFAIHDESTNYRISVKGYQKSSNMNNILGLSTIAGHNGRMFSTKDKDNDDAFEINCSEKLTGGWWFGACRGVNLNGVYLKHGGEFCDPFLYMEESRGIFYHGITSCKNRVVFSEMKIRYNV